MKSWFSRIKSSVNPLALRSSPKFCLQLGSKASSFSNPDDDDERAWWPLTLPERLSLVGGLGDSGGVGAEEWRWPPKRPPKKP
jgi:hypothetical protein